MRALCAFCLAQSILIGSLAANRVDEASSIKEWLDGSTMTGDWGGLRTALAQKGISFGLTYYAEVWGNTTGGIKDGAVYTGLGQISTTVDLGKFFKLVDWQGATFYSRWLRTSGQDASGELVGNLFTVSDIAAFQTFRNIELWLQQTWWDKKISLRVGQLAADQEFVISQYGLLFINGTLGWPASIYLNIPNGGPGYPMGAPGVRLMVNPVEPLTLLAAVFQGDVFPENVNRHGFRWRLNAEQGFLWLGEAQYQHDFWLPGTVKAGTWLDSGEFSDPANPKVTRWGDYGFYFIIDQMLYREPAAPSLVGMSKDRKSPAGLAPGQTTTQGLGAFVRLSFAPMDRNFLGFYVDGGLSYQGPIKGRDNDVAGIAFAYGQLTNGAKDSLASGGGENPGYEIVFEATYSAQITPWLAFQPNAQYILHPGGTTNLPNAFVLGARATVTF